MQHAIAISPTIETSGLPPKPDCHNRPKQCRTCIVDGFRIDKETGEIYGKFITSPYQPNTEQYETGTSRPTFSPRQYVQSAVIGAIDNVVYVDFGITDKDNSALDLTASQRNPRNAGRPRLSTVNPIAHIAIEVLTNEPGEQHPLWLDNIIFGSCLTAVGQSHNVCNVAMDEVVGALYLREFKVETMGAQGTSLRKAQRVIKAARHAAHGIHHYLVSRPKLLQSYEDAAKLEASLAPI